MSQIPRMAADRSTELRCLAAQSFLAYLPAFDALTPGQQKSLRRMAAIVANPGAPADIRQLLLHVAAEFLSPEIEHELDAAIDAPVEDNRTC